MESVVTQGLEGRLRTARQAAALAACLALAGLPPSAAGQDLALDTADGLELVHVIAEPDTVGGRAGIKLTADPVALEAAAKRRQEAAAAARARGEELSRGPAANERFRTSHLAIVEGSDFGNGTIELEVAGQPRPGSQGGARGFVGVAWRVKDSKTYDCFYLRPTNGRADDQLRRNHTVQYISHPEWTWFRFRSETPSKYETYADIVPGQWIPVKIVVNGEKARIHVNGAEQPTLIVNDVKSGAEARGKVALWMEGSTVAHYRNLRITAAD